jgi:hypothetical protein
MPAPTDILSDDVKDLRESHQRLADEVHDLRDDLAGFRVEVTGEFGKLRTEVAGEFGKLRTEVAGEFGKFRTEVAGEFGKFRTEVANEFGKLRAEVAKDLGTINGTLVRLETRLDHSVSVAKWTIGILTPVILGLIGAAFWLTWHAAKLDSRVEQVEKAVLSKDKVEASNR